MDCYCDYEPAEFCRTTNHVARKRHKCGECGTFIPPGEKYEIASGKWGGEFGSFKTCKGCKELRNWLNTHVPCFCWCYGNLIDDARDEIAQGRIREIPGMLFEVGRLAVKIRQRQKGESNEK